MSSVSSWSWVTMTVVTCTSSCRRRSHVRRPARTFASSAPKGSSSNRTLGSIARSPRRCCSTSSQDRVTRLENTVRWAWAPGDVAVWDNRATRHYAVADYDDHPRRLHRITLVGDVPVSPDGARSVVRRREPLQRAARVRRLSGGWTRSHPASRLRRVRRGCGADVRGLGVLAPTGPGRTGWASRPVGRSWTSAAAHRSDRDIGDMSCTGAAHVTRPAIRPRRPADPGQRSRSRAIVSRSSGSLSSTVRKARTQSTATSGAVRFRLSASTLASFHRRADSAIHGSHA